MQHAISEQLTPGSEPISCRVKIGILLGALLCAIQPAYANNMPAPFPVLYAVWLMLPPIVILLTWFGGGYSVLAKRRELKIGWQGTIWWRVFLVLVTPLAIGMFVLIHGWAMVRAVHMISWGKKAASNDSPEFLAGANSKRLLAAGGILLVVTALHFVIQFHLWRDLRSLSKTSFAEVTRQLNKLNEEAGKNPSAENPVREDSGKQ